MLDMTFSLKELKTIIFKTTNTSQHVEFFHCLIFIVLAYIVSIFFQTFKFLIDHHCETKSESSDSVAFIRIVRCSCRVFKTNLAERFDICEILQLCL